MKAVNRSSQWMAALGPLVAHHRMAIGQLWSNLIQYIFVDIWVASTRISHDDVIKGKQFPRYWPFVRGTTGHRWIRLTKASGAELWCFYDLRLNTWLSKQAGRRLFEALSRSLWRHCNGCTAYRLPKWFQSVRNFQCLSLVLVTMH